MSRLRKLQQNKPLIIALSVALLLVIAGSALIAMTSNNKKGQRRIPESSQASNQGLADSNTELQQTLDKEEAKRADQKNAHDANKNYKKLAW